jgi:hypothetical protein
MSHQVTPLADQFGVEVRKALDLIEATEKVRSSNPSAQVKRDFSIYRIELIYELAYLRIFLFWEQFLEESLVRYLCGYENVHGRAALISGVYDRRIEDARTRILHGRSYLLWHNPQEVVNRASGYISSGTHETVINSNLIDLQHFANIRHRIAHLQEDARRKFDTASMGLCGKRFQGARPGKLLRHKFSPTQRWIEKIGLDFLNLAKQITP